MKIDNQTETAQGCRLQRMVRVLPGVPERVETGPVQFGDDWPGVFIRGDNAGYYALCLKSVIEGNSNPIATHILAELQKTLAGCIQGSAGQPLEMHPNESSSATRLGVCDSFGER